jgi:hypothetical protein
MKGNGHRPKPGNNSPEEREKPPSDAGDERKGRIVRVEPDERGEMRRQSSRQIRMARRGEDQKLGTDFIAAVVIILVMGLACWAAYVLWMHVLSQPARHFGSGPNIVLPR